MWRYFSQPRAQWLSVGWSALLICGLFVSDEIRILPSIGVAGLFLTGVGYALGQRRLAQWQRWPALLPFLLVYLVHLASGLLHSHLAQAALRQDLVLELPFLLLPVAFLLLPVWRPAHLRALWLLLMGCSLGAAGRALAYYLPHAHAINAAYIQSQVMPTEPDHIRFSLLVSMAVLAGAGLVVRRELPVRLRWATLVGIVFLFLFQHLLAARSGLATLYGAGGLWLGWVGWQARQWRTVLVSVALATGLAGAALYSFPTLQTRIANTRFDVEQVHLANAANNFSMTARVYSYKVAWVVIQQHPLLGVGKVQLADALAAQYRYRYPEISSWHYLFPHNQFIYNVAAHGLLGLLLFLAGFYYPLWVGIRAGNILQALIYLIVTLSFLVEYTLESQIGVLTGLFFLLLASAPTASEAPSQGMSSSLP